MNVDTSTELRRISLTLPTRSCELDPFLTFLLKEFVDLFPFFRVLCSRSRMEIYRHNGIDESWFLSSSAADLTHSIRPLLDRLLMFSSCPK